MSGVRLHGVDFEQTTERYGRMLLAAAFGFALLIVFGATWLAPDVVPYLPLGIILSVGGWYLFQRPALNLCVVIGLFPLIADFEEGIEPKEVLFGLYFAAFLVHWYFRRVILERKKLLRSTDDYLLAAVLVMVVVYVPVSLVFGAVSGSLVSEFIAMSALAVYFPAKAAAKEHPRGLLMIFGALLVVGLYITVRNMIWMRELISNATVAWQITQKARIVSNEILLVVPAVAMLAWNVHLRRWRDKSFVLLAFLAMVLALVFTQSRGYWISTLFGCLVMLIGLNRDQRKELILFGVISMAVSALIVLLYFSETALLLFAGMFNRLLSLGSAVTRDISLVNRFLESDAVWERIADNPILGYGFGVPYEYFNITISGTRVWSFIHNGYLALWYRFGIFGAILFSVFWFRSIYHAFRVVRADVPRWDKIGALTSLAVLSSLVLSNVTSNAFARLDSLLMFGLLTGLTSGVFESSRVRNVIDS